MHHPFRFLFLLVIIASAMQLPALKVWAGWAWGHDLFSYTLLVPIVTTYLLWENRAKLTVGPHSSRYIALIPLTIAVGALIVGGGLLGPDDASAKGVQSWLFWRMTAWSASVIACLIGALGIEKLKAFAFPIFFLFAVIPLHPQLEANLEWLLQTGSAETAAAYFFLTGMTLYRDGLIFYLPGIALEVAPECSGIHSTLVLFITSLVGGYLFLKSPWHRFVLSAAVLPLGLLRNGFRVWTLGTLCVYDDPAWIHSPLHHQGGPIFFALSLLPFSGLLYWLYRREANRRPPPSQTEPA